MSGNDYGSAATGSSLFPSDDGLSKVSEFLVDNAGKELSSSGMQYLVFLEANGSRDLADRIMGRKRYMSSTADMLKTIEKLSPAQTMRDQMEYSAKLRQDSMK
jgi:hypothetical protein